MPDTAAFHVSAQVVVVIVRYRNAEDIMDCLGALAASGPEPAFEVFIAENGGTMATDRLIAALSAPNGRCVPLAEDARPIHAPLISRVRSFQLMGTRGDIVRRVHVGEVTDDLGHAGGINAWLRPLLEIDGWEGVWILNPDTQPAPTALAELVACARDRGKGMVGSRTIQTTVPDRVHSRGLAWRKLVAKTRAVDYQARIMPAPDKDDLEARLDAPRGASLYVTRALLERIGLMDERFFLYFEDLEWGIRARSHGGPQLRASFDHHAQMRHHDRQRERSARRVSARGLSQDPKPHHFREAGLSALAALDDPHAVH
jgi:N-acetylglucosaminyl-diphospho-decaprenol L-rhamnosyltransferase